MADPFGYLLANIGKPVTVRVANGDRVAGLLRSVDDHGNILLGEWALASTSADAAPAPAAAATAGSSAPVTDGDGAAAGKDSGAVGKGRQSPSRTAAAAGGAKRPRGIAGVGGADEHADAPSIRFVRGAEVVAISFTAAPAA